MLRPSIGPLAPTLAMGFVHPVLMYLSEIPPQHQLSIAGGGATGLRVRALATPSQSQKWNLWGTSAAEMEGEREK